MFVSSMMLARLARRILFRNPYHHPPATISKYTNKRIASRGSRYSGWNFLESVKEGSLNRSEFIHMRLDNDAAVCSCSSENVSYE